MKKEKPTHPILDEEHSARQKHGGLWNTHAGFPVSHLVDLAPVASDQAEAPIVPETIELPPAIERIRSKPDISGLSPFSQWLMSQKPAAVDGEPAPVRSEVRLPVDPDGSGEVENEVVEKPPKAKKKKKDKKKRKKKKKSPGGEEKTSGKHGVLETGIVTDILAELTAEQGYTEDAIQMYRRLVHLHPERTAFYLERIQTLKKEDQDG